MGAVLRRYWPYDEVSVENDRDPDHVLLSTPWLKLRLKLPSGEKPRALAFLQKLKKQQLNGTDLNEVNWFFQSLQNYPLAYILPRNEIDGPDKHRVVNDQIDMTSPKSLLLSLTQNSKELSAIQKVAKTRLPLSWSWDVEAALQFSQVENGIDPVSLFSVGRRFHLLNDIENNQTGSLISFVHGLKDNPLLFRPASALILRQNHYITEQCESVLKTVLPISGESEDKISEFIQAESGHDQILAKSIVSLGADPQNIEVLTVTKTLMEIFRFIAQRNLLAFAMVVDIFERTSYRDEDPMTSVLKAGNEHAAGKQTDIHREINDLGGHENVAVSFLDSMSAIDHDFAREALLLSELATIVVHQLSIETIEKLRP